MKYVNFEKLIVSNFLSIGKEPIEIDFKTGLNVISGINKDKSDRRNGVGKCVHKNTEIDIKIYDKQVKEDFIEFLKNK